MAAHFRPGDCVIYRKQKLSTHPGLHARDIEPAPNGDTYSYLVDKFYRVIAVQPDQRIVVRTRRGREHILSPDDPALRHAHWWERLLLHSRFPPAVPVT
jgi:hypothetical protein